MYDRDSDTPRRFRLPDNSPISDVRAGMRLGVCL
jgi:hypothetical protein